MNGQDGRDEQGRLFLNPGEVSGWTFGDPTVMLLETTTKEVRVIHLLTETKREITTEST